jgi:hypothetical protein
VAREARSFRRTGSACGASPFGDSRRPRPAAPNLEAGSQRRPVQLGSEPADERTGGRVASRVGLAAKVAAHDPVSRRSGVRGSAGCRRAARSGVGTPLSVRTQEKGRRTGAAFSEGRSDYGVRSRLRHLSRGVTLSLHRLGDASARVLPRLGDLTRRGFANGQGSLAGATRGASWGLTNQLAKRRRRRRTSSMPKTQRTKRSLQAHSGQRLGDEVRRPHKQQRLWPRAGRAILGEFAAPCGDSKLRAEQPAPCSDSLQTCR